MKILDSKIKVSELAAMDDFGYGFVKAVVDINRGIMGVNAELHSDIERELLRDGSCQDDLWGINLYPDNPDEFIEFDSIINIRPRQNNPSRDVLDSSARDAVRVVVNKLVELND